MVTGIIEKTHIISSKIKFIWFLGMYKFLKSDKHCGTDGVQI